MDAYVYKILIKLYSTYVEFLASGVYYYNPY